MQFGLEGELSALTVVEPLAFLDMVYARAGGQDPHRLRRRTEGGLYEVPCITMRDDRRGRNAGVRAQPAGGRRRFLARILSAYQQGPQFAPEAGFAPYGDGFASKKIIENLMLPA